MFDSTCAVYKVVQMDPEDRRRARLSRRRQRERDRRASESAEQRESRLARRRARDRARRASQSEIHKSTKFMVYSLSIAYPLAHNAQHCPSKPFWCM